MKFYKQQYTEDKLKIISKSYLGEISVLEHLNERDSSDVVHTKWEWL